jgi:hypothetical protein
MSQVQELAKPYLIPLLKGERPDLSRHAQACLARWALMFTMVFESADFPTMAVHRHDRERMRNHGQLPDNWLVWAVRFQDAERPSSPTIHRGLAVFSPDDLPPGKQPVMNTQITIGCFGSVALITFSTSAEDVFHLYARQIEELARSLGFVRLWPHQDIPYLVMNEFSVTLKEEVLMLFRDLVSEILGVQNTLSLYR